MSFFAKSNWLLFKYIDALVFKRLISRVSLDISFDNESKVDIAGFFEFVTQEKKLIINNVNNSYKSEILAKNKKLR